MASNSVQLTVAAVALLLMTAACNGPRGPMVYEHVFNRPGGCVPGPKPCPCECPDFPLPPGGPYLTTPGIHAPLNPNVAPEVGGEISVKQK
jgi:hypothetical protein